jgi:hypothetical protein
MNARLRTRSAWMLVGMALACAPAFAGSLDAAAAGLGSWAAFAPMGNRAMVMGDTVVFQDEWMRRWTPPLRMA